MSGIHLLNDEVKKHNLYKSLLDKKLSTQNNEVHISSNWMPI